MMRNRGPRNPAMHAGSGLLGEGPGMSSGMKRMMAGVGGGLLGSAPKPQPRSLLEAPGVGRGMRDPQNVQRGHVDRSDFSERQSYNQPSYSQGGRMEQQADRGYYDEPRGRYMEEQPTYQRDYGNQEEEMFDIDIRHQGQYGSQDQDFGYDRRDIERYHDGGSNPRGLLEEPQLRKTQREQPRSLLDNPMRNMERFEGRGLMDYPAEKQSLLGMPSEQRVGREQSRNQQDRLNMQYDDHHGLADQARERALDPHRGQHGLLGSARKHGGFMDDVQDQRSIDIDLDRHSLHDDLRDQHGMMEMTHHMELSAPPRPPRNLMEIRNEPRSLLDTPAERPGRATGREPRSLLDMDQRGAMDRRGDRGPASQRGLLDLPEKRLKSAPQNRKDLNQQTMMHSDLMEKADLQMKLLQQQEKMREMELLKQQQQAVLLQHQQQHLQQMKQQEQIQQQLQIKQQMQQAELMMKASKGQSRGGGIPSLFDVPTQGKPTLGKRPSAVARAADNKRARTGLAARRDRRPLPRNRKDSAGDRSGGRRQDRGRRGRNHSRHESPDHKKRDRKDSGSRAKTTTQSKDRQDRSKEVRNERGKERSEREKDKEKEKEKPKTEAVLEQYDPAEPTDDVIEIKDEVKPAEKVEVGVTEVNVEIKGEKQEEKKEEKKEEQKDVEKEKDDKQKHQEISLTVTVNKKGRSVNDADKKEAKTKLYKCNVCSVECYDEESFARHMNGKKHSEKMKIVMSSTSQQAILIKSRIQAEEHLRQIEGNKAAKHGSQGSSGSQPSRGKPLESHCKVCDKKFTGAYKDHKEAPEHKAREDRSKAGCKVCKVTTFCTYLDYVKHLQSNWHIKKMKQDSWPECKLCNQKFKSPRKFVQHCKTDHHIQNRKKLSSEDEEEEFGDLVTLDTIGYEEDASSADQESKGKDMETEDSLTFIKPMPADGKEQKTSTPKPTQKPVKVEPVTPVKPEEEEVVPDSYNPSLPIGQKYVVPVSGFFCKLCHKFYNNENAARVTHCQSQTHYEKLKKAIDAKRAKAEEMAKKIEINKSLFDNKNTISSPAVEEKGNKPVENGNQSVDAAANEEHSQDSDSTADQSSDSQNDTVVEVGESTLKDLEGNQDSQEEEEEEVEEVVKKPTPVKQRARRGGGAPRARRGRK